MKTKHLLIILGFLIFFALLFGIEGAQEEPVSWTESYSKDDKIPFGNFIIYEQLKQLFPQREITQVAVSVTEQLDENYKTESSSSSHIDEYGNVIVDEIEGRKYKNSFIPSNYIFINKNLQLDEISVKYLMDFTANGGNVFISSRFFSDAIQDSLHFHLSQFSVSKQPERDGLLFL